MENRDSFEEKEITVAAVSRKYKKYEVLSVKGSLAKSFRSNFISLCYLQKV